MAQMSADLARDLLGADRCSLWLLDENAGELYTRVAHGIEEIRIPKGAGIAGATVIQRRPILVNDPLKSNYFLDKVDATSGYRTQCVLTVPLWIEGEVIGAIQALNKPGGFTDQDAELLRFVAIYAAAAIQAERLRREAEAAMVLQRELDIAAEVQRKLFPQSALQIPGLEVAAMCRPARLVGGDFYDLLDLGQGRFGFTLGDVAGKGFPAAVMMASVHTLLRRLLVHDPENLAQVAAELNEAIHDSSTAERYSTLFCGMLNAGRNELLYVNAGHVQPILIRAADGRVDCLEGGDLPVGLLSGVPYSQYRQPVAPGDLIICISDGITEAQDIHGELWGQIEMQQLLSRHRERSANELLNLLISAADAYVAHAEQSDDMTVVLIRILP